MNDQDQEFQLLAWWNEALEDNPFLRCIWRVGQFLWRWIVCVIGQTLIVTFILGADPIPESGPRYLRLLMAALIAFYWARDTCWRKR